jgi:CheY-like chemotaxis protein
MTTKRILLIDDEADLRHLVEICLKQLAGWNVLLAASAEDGFNLAILEQPDVILLDLIMPGMTGLEFLKKRKTESNLSLIPVVLLSTSALLYNSKQLENMGVKGAISKPFNAITLHQEVAAILGWTRYECG